MPRNGVLGPLGALVSAFLVSGAIVAGTHAAFPDAQYDTHLDHINLSEGNLGDGYLSGAEGALFREVSGSVGIDYEPKKRLTPIGFQGTYVSDYDRDGWPDVLLIGGEKPVLYRNEEGYFQPSGEMEGYGSLVRSAHFFDYDNDDDEDLLLLRRGASPLFLENENVSFSRKKGVLETRFSNPIGAVSADYNGDGCLDLFVYQNGNWNANKPFLSPESSSIRENPDRGEEARSGQPNRLFRGDCEGFVEVTGESGIEGEKWSLAASFTDLDNDSLADIHVANDFSEDVLYFNRGDGRFAREEMGGESRRHGMSSEVAFINGDGLPDIFVTNIFASETFTEGEDWCLLGYGERCRVLVDNTGHRNVISTEGNNVFVNRGDGEFEDMAPQLGLEKGGWAWAASVADFNNDGHIDVLHSNLFSNPNSDVGVENYPRMPNFWTGNGEGFVKRDSRKSGFEPTSGRGIARADIDRDGDMDVIFSDRGYQGGDAAFKVYENLAGGSYLKIRLERRGEPETNSVLVLETSAGTQRRLVDSRSDFLSQETRTAHFGVTGTLEELRVIWPEGSRDTFRNLEENSSYAVSPGQIREVGG